MIDWFYKSREWLDFRLIVIFERLNENGETICEHCGKPIVKAYDIILHHIIPLNDANVYDANIALNPKNIMLVHHRCHNKIHNKLGYANRQVYLVYGSPLSGKSTFVKDNMEPGDLIVDIDNIWQCVSGCDRYIKPNRLKQNVFAIHNQMIDMVRVRQGKWLNAYVIGGYPLIGERERLRKRLGAREIFIDTPKEECLKRAENRPEEWTEYVNNWWEKFSSTPPPLPKNGF